MTKRDVSCFRDPRRVFSASWYDVDAGQCLAVSTALGRWSDADHTCVDHGGRLATVDSPSRLSAIGNMTFNDVGAWIGGRRNFTRWAWQNGLSLGSFSQWETGTPVSSFPCVALVTSTASWHQQDCATTIPYICQKEGTVCVSTAYCNAIQPDPESRLCFLACTNRLDWFSARQSCRNASAQLLVILSEDMMNTGLLSKSNISAYWIGLYKESMWWWTATGAEIAENHWSSSSGVDGDCLALTTNIATRETFWISDDCNKTKRFICEIPPDTFRSPVVSLPTTEDDQSTRGLPVSTTVSSTKASLIGGLVVLAIVLVAVLIFVIVAFVCFSRRRRETIQRSRSYARMNNDNVSQNGIQPDKQDPEAVFVTSSEPLPADERRLAAIRKLPVRSSTAFFDDGNTHNVGWIERGVRYMAKRPPSAGSSTPLAAEIDVDAACRRPAERPSSQPIVEAVFPPDETAVPAADAVSPESKSPAVKGKEPALPVDTEATVGRSIDPVRTAPDFVDVQPSTSADDVGKTDAGETSNLWRRSSSFSSSAKVGQRRRIDGSGTSEHRRRRASIAGNAIPSRPASPPDQTQASKSSTDDRAVRGVRLPPLPRPKTGSGQSNGSDDVSADAVPTDQHATASTPNNEAREASTPNSDKPEAEGDRPRRRHSLASADGERRHRRHRHHRHHRGSDSRERPNEDATSGRRTSVDNVLDLAAPDRKATGDLPPPTRHHHHDDRHRHHQHHHHHHGDPSRHQRHRHHRGHRREHRLPEAGRRSSDGVTQGDVAVADPVGTSSRSSTASESDDEEEQKMQSSN